MNLEFNLLYMASSTSFNELLDTKEKKLSFFQNLILLALSDGELDEQESDFLLMIGDQLGLSEEDTKHITDNLSSLEFVIPEERLQKTFELQTLVMMMMQDGKLAQKEYNLCREYAGRIGYTEELLDDLINQLDK
jgi:spore coat polysaccharide biosynthesis predicted glycosyltransferase SpsG